MGTKGRQIVGMDIDELLGMLNQAFADEWLAYYQYWLGADPENRLVYPLSSGGGLNFEYIFDPQESSQACVAIPAAVRRCRS